MARAHGGSRSLYCAGWRDTGDPPTAQYDNNMDAYFQRNIPIGSYSTVVLHFWLWYETEATYDQFFLCFSGAGGVSGSWRCAPGDYRSGSSGGWVEWWYNISTFSGNPDFWLALRFSSDNSVVREGAYVDDLEIVVLP